MNTKRVFEIMKNEKICDVYYEKHPVWIQYVKDNIAKVGFIDKSEEKNVYIEDLYEGDL